MPTETPGRHFLPSQSMLPGSPGSPPCHVACQRPKPADGGGSTSSNHISNCAGGMDQNRSPTRTIQ